ncbi:MAG: cyanophycin synthetase [Candidatus Andeanibacterium colombiense]|uniref:Cyanophycin synthetase n=1 Tax=Candidatus Andeanibacterium colombiense TaxID=3121345 RepID=A0AAJ5X2D1_9SPHN|nr:MAG: cyanophycin synthetase [Sphingomonadaceae bacterium]
MEDRRDSESGAGDASFRVLETRIYRNASLYGRLPLARIRVDLGVLEAYPTNTISGFTETLLNLLPGLRSHGCSCPDQGGFPHRLEEGTWLGHVIEHVALELQTRAGSPVSRGKTRSVPGKRGVYDILYRYQDEKLALAAGSAAVRAVLSLLPEDLRTIEGDALLAPPATDNPQDVEALVPALKRILARNALGPTTAALVTAALDRKIPVTRFPSHIQLGYGSFQKRISASITGATSHLGVVFAGDKFRAKTLLHERGLPVPQGRLVQTADEALAAAQTLGFPVVIKPLDGNHGRGVSTDLATEAQIRAAFSQAAEVKPRVIVEQHLRGNDHRILVIGGKVVAVAERVPAQVKGDGIHTAAELIEIQNSDPRRGDGHANVLTRIKVDARLEDMLARQDKTLSSIPGAGETVLLRGTANLSSGGTAVDRTDAIHPDNRLVAEMAAHTIGLDIAGVDFVTPDITRSVRETGGGIVEINAAPGFRMHLAPSEGTPRDVAAPVIGMLFPNGTSSRIPIVAITGTNGKSTTTRMVAAILRETGRRVGRTDTSGVFIDDMLLRAGDASGPRSAAMLLTNPAVDAAVFETARGGILREGLGFDTCSVGAVLNVTEDHLGLKGVDTLEQLAALKSVVLKGVARRGATVLNLDDRYCRRMARRARSKVVWFSLNTPATHPRLTEHLSSGGVAVLRERTSAGDELVIRVGSDRTFVMLSRDIPGTAGGAALFNVANALAAIAIACALGIRAEIIADALRRFSSSFEDNPGRFNVIDDHPFRVILDYAHNAASLKALGESLPGLRPAGGRTIGMVSIPGDRREQDIIEIGRLAVTIFDRVVFREGPDGRTRPRGEVLKLLEQGAAEAGGNGRFESIMEEADAVAHCLAMARPGDLVVLFPTKVEDVFRQVKAYAPIAAGTYAAA